MEQCLYWEPRKSLASQEIPHIYGIQNSFVSLNIMKTIHILSQINPVSSPLHFLKIHIIIIIIIFISLLLLS